MKDWKITVGYDINGYLPVQQGSRYTLEASAAHTPDEVAYMALRDAVARQLKLEPARRCDYVSVGVWDTSGEKPEVLSVWTAKWTTVEAPSPGGTPIKWELGAYTHPGGPSVEPAYLGSARTSVSYDDWDKGR